ncbi:hypothetical protein [Microbacterium sp. CGR1]|uniref:hypothetical protein n=1 Tax=Microbacterium sp. CGR1 TaxID=1696072 RepID=UPI003DA2C820
MSSTPTRRGRGFLIGAGVILVAVFLGWLVLRNHGGGGVDVGMGSILGWVTHGIALLVLLGGVALIARGTTRPPSSDSDADD